MVGDHMGIRGAVGLYFCFDQLVISRFFLAKWVLQLHRASSLPDFLREQSMHYERYTCTLASLLYRM